MVSTSVAVLFFYAAFCARFSSCLVLGDYYEIHGNGDDDDYDFWNVDPRQSFDRIGAVENFGSLQGQAPIWLRLPFPLAQATRAQQRRMDTGSINGQQGVGTVCGRHPQKAECEVQT